MSSSDRLDEHLAEAMRHLEAAETVIGHLDVSVALTPNQRSELNAMTFSICRLGQRLGEALEGPDVVYDLTTSRLPANDGEPLAGL